MQWLRTYGTTAGAIVISAALTAPYALQGIRTLLGDRDFETMREGLVLFGAPAGGESAENASLITGVLVGVAALVALIVILGLVLRREWAREAGIVVFGIFGLVGTLVSVGGMTADPPAPRAGWGLVSGLASLVVVGLLLAPATGLVVGLHEHEVQRKRRSTARG